MYIASLKFGTVKGEINGVTVKILTDRWDDPHVVVFGTNSVTHGENKIELQHHSHPWPDKIMGDPHDYANEAVEARNTAWRELEKRDLDDIGEWHT